MPSYSDYIDPQVIAANIGADYANESKIFNSGIVRDMGAPSEGSQVEWIKTALFSGNPEGQAIGVGTEINLEEEEQTSYALPIFSRADGALIDQEAERIISKAPYMGLSFEQVQEKIMQSMTEAVNTQAMQMYDSALAKVLSGCTEYMATNDINYLDTAADQIALNDFTQVLSEVGEAASRFTDGGAFVVLKGDMKQKLISLGLVAATSNTMGNIQQDEIVRTGSLGTLLGMNVLDTDKIDGTDDTDQYISIVGRGSMPAFRSVIDVRPLQEKERSFQEILKFRFHGGSVVDGLSWSANKSNIVTNTQLATGTNYETAASNTKNIPLCVIRTPAPTFS